VSRREGRQERRRIARPVARCLSLFLLLLWWLLALGFVLGVVIRVVVVVLLLVLVRPGLFAPPLLSLFSCLPLFPLLLTSAFLPRVFLLELEAPMLGPHLAYLLAQLASRAPFVEQPLVLAPVAQQLAAGVRQLASQRGEPRIGRRRLAGSAAVGRNNNSRSVRTGAKHGPGKL